MRSLLFALVVAPVITLSAHAQTAQPATECAAGAGGAYLRCALWMDGMRVRRGTDGAIVAQPGFFRPLRLSQIVQGDSAIHFGRAFERNTARAGLFGLVSAGLIAGALIVANNYDCNPDALFGVCTNDDDSETLTVLALSGGGLISGIVSSVFQDKARRHAARAVFWHNAAFAR